MTMKRSISTSSNNKTKLPKLDIENSMDYTKLLTSEDIEAIEIDNEPELEIVRKLEKNKTGLKLIKKTTPKDEKENKGLKKIKEKSNTVNGIFLTLFYLYIIKIKIIYKLYLMFRL